MNNKVGRNDPCPCGSGKKYKNCCMGKEEKKATHTPEGKRKFKASVIKIPDLKSQGLFQSSTPTPGSTQPRLKMTKVDYRQQEEEKAELPFEIPTPGTYQQEKEIEAEEKAPLEEKFRPTKEDFQVKKEKEDREE